MVVIYKQGKKLLTGIESVSSLSVYLWYIVIAKTCLIPKHKNHTFLFSHYVCTQPHPTLCDSMVVPWTTALQTPLFLGLSWQEYWSGLPFLPPGNLLGLGIELSLLQLLHWQVDCLPLSYLGSTFSHCAFLQMTSISCIQLHFHFLANREGI